MAFTSQNLLAILDGVTVVQRDTAQKMADKAGGIAASLSAYLRTGKRAHATIGALAHVYQGVLETLAHGQKSKLQGFALAAKRTTSEFRALVALGILSDSGDVLASVEKGFQAKALDGRTLDFVAAVMAEAAAIKEADKLARESVAGADAAGADAAGADAAGAASTLSEGQQDDAAVARIISRIALLSNDNIAAIRAALATLDAAAGAAAGAAATKSRKTRAKPVAA